MATIRKRKNKWQVQVRRQDLPKPISRSFHSKKDAEAWTREYERLADRGELPCDRSALERITLGELVVRYRDSVTIKKRGAQTETIVLSAFLRHPICKQKLSVLQPSHFASYVKERLEVVASATVRRQLNPIHNMFEIAKDEWGIPIRQNPLDKVRLKVVDQKRERRLKDGEYNKIIHEASKCRNSSVIPIIKLAVETGMRRGEILSIKTNHIDTNKRTLLIPESKNGHSRCIPLSNAAMAILDSVRPSEGVFFPISANAFRLAWERAKKRAKIEDLHFHDLRHEAISRFFEIGLTVPEVAMISGHRDASMLLRYAHAQTMLVHQKLNA